MTYEASYYLVVGIVLGLSARPLWLWGVRWAEGLRYEVEAQRVLDRRRSCTAPRSVPSPRVRLVHSAGTARPYDVDGPEAA